ncbi:hypothetical protein [Nocardiopsis valliformis]|uniref:hypothetical protein n=1 Tax=Nocardiopsis valliformis TaxID=239974 RepID=UPI000344A9B8|nr:hypothetical protein [Nocardiopsis valliformis]
MDDLVTDLGKHVAERWLALLTLSGVLYLAVAAVAFGLDHSAPWDFEGLADRASHAAEGAFLTSLGGQVLVGVAVLLTGVAVGLTARTLGGAVERLWLAESWESWPGPFHGLAEWRVRERQAEWSERYTELAEAQERAVTAALHKRLHGATGTREAETGVGATGPKQPSPTQAYLRLSRISEEWPHRPTWCGDRIGSVTERLRREHSLELPRLWPHLWLVLPETVQKKVATARENLTHATVLSAWAVLYLLLGLVWWPATLVSVAVGAVGWWRTRTATRTYAVLLEACVRIHLGDLTRRLGIPFDGQISSAVGEGVSQRLDLPAPPAPPFSPDAPRLRLRWPRRRRRKGLPTGKSEAPKAED